MEIQQNYESPRWSMEISDCSMPMSLDTYSRCSYNCLYCFAYFQKSHCVQGYLTGQVRSISPDKVKRLFHHALYDRSIKVNKDQAQFIPYIQDRRIMQWGGLADEFDTYERRFGITLELLKYFDKIDYPLSFSTKAVWWTEDERYMELFSRHTHNWHVKISIITGNEEKARRIEKGVPSPAQRLEAIRRLSSLGIHVTLRLRPYIIGVSDDYKDLIRQAYEAGADSVTTEFFCMESRANQDLKDRYNKMSDIVGYDIYKFYLKNSKQSGYKRLNRAIKAPIIHAMRDYVHSLGMRFHVSDSFCRESNDSCNCCGVPPEWEISQTGQFGNAILIAKVKGEVRFSDIRPQIEKYFPFMWDQAAGFNTGNNRKRAAYVTKTMPDYLRDKWNDIKTYSGVFLEYGGILQPAGVDEEGNVIYRYAGKTTEGERGGNGKT